MQDSFNLRRFLVENKITTVSRLEEITNLDNQTFSAEDSKQLWQTLLATAYSGWGTGNSKIEGEILPPEYRVTLDSREDLEKYLTSMKERFGCDEFKVRADDNAALVYLGSCQAFSKAYAEAKDQSKQNLEEGFFLRDYTDFDVENYSSRDIEALWNKLKPNVKYAPHILGLTVEGSVLLHSAKELEKYFQDMSYKFRCTKYWYAYAGDQPWVSPDCPEFKKAQQDYKEKEEKDFRDRQRGISRSDTGDPNKAGEDLSLTNRRGQPRWFGD